MKATMMIDDTNGLHARIAVALVQTANKFVCDINLIYRDKVVDLKSVLGLMSLGIPSGTSVVVEASGPEAEEAIKAMMEVL